MKATAALVWMFTGILLAQLFVVPLTGAWWLLIPIALLSNPAWSLIHEGIHGHHRGRWLAILFGFSIDALRSVHLAHHRHNRVAEQADKGSRISYYWQLCGGMYMLEVLLPILALLPLEKILRSQMDDFTRDVLSGIQSRASTIKKDALVIAVIYGFSFYLYGSNWHWLALSLFARAFLVSWLDYIYHYNTPTGDKNHGRNLWLPAPLSFAILRFNLHGVHHKSPWLPWYKIASALAVDYDCTYWKAAINVWRGPIK